MPTPSDVRDTYACPGCGMLLEPRESWADGWLLCPECGRPGRPPAHPAPRGPRPPARAHATGLSGAALLDRAERPEGAGRNVLATMIALLTLFLTVFAASMMGLDWAEGAVLGAIMGAGIYLLFRSDRSRRRLDPGAAGFAAPRPPDDDFDDPTRGRTPPHDHDSAASASSSGS